MLALKLYVADEQGVLQQVDLFADESVSLTRAIQDVRDIEKIFTDFTKTFSVPASRTNNKVFKHFHNYNIVGFDARIKRDAELFLNDEPFKKGKIKLEGATTKNNKAHTYKITFFGSTVNLKDILGEDKLDALNFLNNFTFDYTDANVKTYMQDGLDVTVDNVLYEDALLFPLITHTKRLIYDSTTASPYVKTDVLNNIVFANNNNDYGLELSQLKPALRVDVIIKAIEQTYPLKFTDDFFNSGNIPYYNLYLWLHHKTGSLFVDDESTSVFGNFVEQGGDDNVITLNRGSFLVPHRGSSDDNDRQFDLRVTPTSTSATFSIIIKKDGLVFKEFKDQQNNAGNGAFWREEAIKLKKGVYTIEVECSEALTFGFVGFVKRLRKFSQPDINWTGTATTIVGDNINAASKLPEIKVIDFVTGLFKMFNLTAFQNSNGDIEVKTLDSFYESSNRVWDITKDIDKTEQTVDSVLPFKQIDFQYKSTKTFLAANYNERLHKEWGAANETPKDKVDGQVYTVENPFEHMMFERLPDENTAVTDKTEIQYGWSADIKQSPSLGEPLLFYPVLQTGISFGIIDSSGVVSNKTSTYIPSNSILLTDSVNINYAAEINEFNQNVQFNKTLFDQYYKKYITEVFDKGRRMTTTKAYLPLNVTKNMTLADKFRISDRLYKINKIVTNFENNLSTLELINTRTNLGDLITVDTQIKQKYNNVLECITVDTTSISVDSIIQRADMDCQNVLDGLILDNPSDNNSSDILNPNNPDGGNSSNNIVVSPPTIAKIGDNIANTQGTSYTISPTWSITELGKIDQTKNIDEYGFIFSTNKDSLFGTDIDLIKTNPQNTVIEYPQNAFNNKPSTPHLVKVTDYAINYGSDYYYIFYGRTNTSTNYDLADAISDIQTVNAGAYCSGDFYQSVAIFNGNTENIATFLTKEGFTRTHTILANAQFSTVECICLDSITLTQPATIDTLFAVKCT
jgi:hypothetical protein